MAKKTTKASIAECAPVDDGKWRAQSALRTLTEAANITKDRELMKAVRAESRAQMKALEKVCRPNQKTR